jgi:hypothetical protein
MEHVKNQSGRKRDTAADLDKVRYWFRDTKRNQFRPGCGKDEADTFSKTIPTFKAFISMIMRH